MDEDMDRCTYCEKPGKLVQVRGMKGEYHLRCVKAAKAAWESEVVEMAAKRKNIEQTSIGFTKDDLRMVDVLAERRGMSRAGLIRFLIRECSRAEGIL
jgi:hypothetical protein